MSFKTISSINYGFIILRLRLCLPKCQQSESFTNKNVVFLGKVFKENIYLNVP